MKCYHCKEITPDSASFCPHCGQNLRTAGCASCGEPLTPAARFCTACGAEVIDATKIAPPDEDPPSEQDMLRLAAAELPPAAPAPNSSVGSNVLVFVAMLALIVVGIYVANKGKPPEATMFSGGPMPGRTEERPSEAESGPTESGQLVRGRVEVASDVFVPPDAVLFITARSSAAQGKGPPLAVRRVAQPAFPLEFELGPQNRMIKEMPWTGPLDVSARLDLDGNAMTRGERDLSSGPGIKNVPLGRDDLRLVLSSTAEP